MKSYICIFYQSVLIAIAIKTPKLNVGTKLNVASQARPKLNVGRYTMELILKNETQKISIIGISKSGWCKEKGYADF